MEQSKKKVRIGRELPTTFETNTGVRHGDRISPKLLNITIEDTLRKVQEAKICWA